MNLYHISQSVNNDYDTFSDAVVCAESEEDARNTHPGWGEDPWKEDRYGTWCKSPDEVTVTYLGEAHLTIKKGIICASFHAG